MQTGASSFKSLVREIYGDLLSPKECQEFVNTAGQRLTR